MRMKQFSSLTLPKGNFFKNSSLLLVSPKTKSASFTWAPEYCAAMSTLKVRKSFGIAYKVYYKSNR